MSENALTPVPLVVAESIAGRVRPDNEDALWTPPPTLGEQVLAQKGWLFIIADGMGGYQGGAVAARIAVQAASASYYAAADVGEGTGAPLAIGESLRQAIQQAHQAILYEQSHNPQYAQMGSTLLMAVIHGPELFVAHVGDSRCYRLRAGRLEQLTEDHSWVAHQVRIGLLTPEEALNNPNRNALTRAVGRSAASTQPDVNRFDWQPGDRLLLCSDGLWNLLPDAEIRRKLTTLDPQAAVPALLNAANDAGGFDNITALVVADPTAPTLTEDTADDPTASISDTTVVLRTPHMRTRRVSLLLLAALAMVVLLVVSAAVVIGQFAAPAHVPAPGAAAAQREAARTDPTATLSQAPATTLPATQAASLANAAIPTSTPPISAALLASGTLPANTPISQATATLIPTLAPGLCVSRTINPNDWVWNAQASGVQVTPNGIGVRSNAHIATRASLAALLALPQLHAPFTVKVWALVGSQPQSGDLWLCFQGDVNATQCVNTVRKAFNITQVDAVTNTWLFEYRFAEPPQLPQLRVVSTAVRSIIVVGIEYCED